ELNAREHEAALVTVPFKWYPGERVLTQAFLWRLLDLEETDGRPIDLVIATKFPSYVVRHPRKVVWLVHQFRQAYDLDRTELGQFGESPEDRALRRAVHRLDRETLGRQPGSARSRATAPTGRGARWGSGRRAGWRRRRGSASGAAGTEGSSSPSGGWAPRRG